MFYFRTQDCIIVTRIAPGLQVVDPGARTGRCQTVYKPGSVPRLPAAMAIPLGRTLRGTSSNQPGRQRGKRLSLPEGSFRRPYSVLLPVRFSVPVPLLGPRCALTAPFHPCRRALRPAGGLLLCGTVSGVAPAGRYPAPFFRGARTFLAQEPSVSSAPGRGHPTVWHRLHLGAWGHKVQAVRPATWLKAPSISCLD